MCRDQKRDPISTGSHGNEYARHTSEYAICLRVGMQDERYRRLAIYGKDPESTESLDKMPIEDPRSIRMLDPGSC